MAGIPQFYGVTFNNIRKALYLLFFGVGEVKDKNGNVVKVLSQDFNSPKYKYIIPMDGGFDNPLLEGEDPAKDTFILFWIEEDESLTQDDYTEEDGIPYSRQKCVADILLRFTGRQAETWVKSIRHLIKRKNVTQIWSGVCNAEKLQFTSPIVPQRVEYFGKTPQIAFDIRFRLYYDEDIATGWEPLEGVDFNIQGEINVP